MTITELIALVSAIIAAIAAGIAIRQAWSARTSALNSTISAEAAVKSAQAAERQANAMERQLDMQEQDRTAARRPKVQLLVQDIELSDGRFMAMGKYLKLKNTGAETINILGVSCDGLDISRSYLQIRFGKEDPREQVEPRTSGIIAWSLPSGMSFNSGGAMPLRADTVHHVTVLVQQHGSPERVELSAQVRVELDGSMSIEDQTTGAAG